MKKYWLYKGWGNTCVKNPWKDPVPTKTKRTFMGWLTDSAIYVMEKDKIKYLADKY